MGNIEESRQRIITCGLVPIIRGNFSSDQVRCIAQVLKKQDISVLEITLNSNLCLEHITTLRKEFGEALFIGAGTVRTLDLFRQAVDAGAQFTIAPNFDAPTVAAAGAGEILHLPGVLTPSEIQQAAAAGCSMVKLFPVDSLGPKYLRAVAAPLDDILFVPTGGITVGNIAEYVKAGAVAAGIGSALVTGPSQSAEELAQGAKALRSAWDAAIATR